MNMYGFHLTHNTEITKNLRYSNWWCRDGGYFCRDNPQLIKMIRPRRRPERSTTVAVVAPTGSIRMAGKRSAKAVNKDIEEASCRPSTATPSGKRRVQLYVKGNPSLSPKLAELNRKYPATQVNQPITEPAAANVADESYVTSNASAEVHNIKTHEALADHPNATFDIVSGNTRKRLTLSQSFPALLHRFITICAISNPDIVQWNRSHTAFNVEIHHPELPELLHTYFQRM